MFRRFATTGATALALGAAALSVATFASVGAAWADPYERYAQPGYGYGGGYRQGRPAYRNYAAEERRQRWLYENRDVIQGQNSNGYYNRALPYSQKWQNAP